MKGVIHPVLYIKTLCIYFSTDITLSPKSVILSINNENATFFTGTNNMIYLVHQNLSD